MRKECRKERRKHRDNTPELLLNQALLGAVIKQAFSDVKNLKANRKKKREHLGLNYKDQADYRQCKKLINEENRESEDACEFFETNRLERFITSYTLPLSASFLRRKYYELQQKEA